MNRIFDHAAAVVMVIACFVPALYSQARAGNELNLGVQAYRQAKFEEAKQHFERAVALAPENGVAHLYLAVTCASRYVPGADTPDNLHFAEEAIEHYQDVLDLNPVDEARISSAKGIAYVYLNMKKFEDSKKYYQMAADLDPKDPEAFYSLGTVDWIQCYQPRMEARARLGLTPEENLNPKNRDQKEACDELKAKLTPVIEDGIDALNKAIQLRADYDDAMAYMNLMYREKADLECDDPTARAEDLKTADEWVDKTIAIKKAKAEKQTQQNRQPD